MGQGELEAEPLGLVDAPAEEGGGAGQPRQAAGVDAAGAQRQLALLPRPQRGLHRPGQPREGLHPVPARSSWEEGTEGEGEGEKEEEEKENDDDDEGGR